MVTERIAIAETCLKAAHDGSLRFPEILGKLIAAGFDGYAVDYRRNAQTFYLPDVDSPILDMPQPRSPVTGVAKAAFAAQRRADRTKRTKGASTRFGAMLNGWSLSVVALNLRVLTTEMAFCRIKRPTGGARRAPPDRSTLLSSEADHNCPGWIDAGPGDVPKAPSLRQRKTVKNRGVHNYYAWQSIVTHRPPCFRSGEQ